MCVYRGELSSTKSMRFGSNCHTPVFLSIEGGIGTNNVFGHVCAPFVACCNTALTGRQRRENYRLLLSFSLLSLSTGGMAHTT